MEDLDTEQFIEEVRKRNAIWDSSSDDYKNRDLKKNQWAEVCMVLYPDFLGLDVNDRLRTVMELQSKWKHIRDSYVRSLRIKRTKSGRRIAKNYIYARQLEFLRPITTTRRTVECSPEQPEVLVNSVDEFEYFGNVIEDSSRGGPVGGVNGCVDVAIAGIVDGGGGGGGQSSVGIPLEGEDKSENGGGGPSRKYSTSSTRGRRRRATFTEQNVRNYIDSYDRERLDRMEEASTCDDMDFFRSMLPLVQVLPLYERMKFRMDVMRIGLEYFEKSRAQVQYSE